LFWPDIYFMMYWSNYHLAFYADASYGIGIYYLCLEDR